MQLKELSDATGVSPASIKFYLREGLLQRGDQVHATRAEYALRHVERLELITGLRTVAGLRIDQIRALVDLIDDPDVARLELLRRTHAMVLGAPSETVPDHPLVHELMTARDWPDHPSDARMLLNGTLREMEAMGLSVSADVVLAYADAADRVASQDLGAVFRAESRDRTVLAVAVGVRAYSKLLASLVALAQASQSIRRLGGAEQVLNDDDAVRG
ncbi:MerR family transcriptional regulator [Arthrobacter tecti]